MIKLINLQKTYKQKNIKVEALKKINLTFPDQGLIFITGVSGTGKSTLLNIIGGLDTFDEGDIIIDGVSLKNFKEKDINNYRNSYVGFVFQEFNLIEEYNIKENISLGCNKEIEENKINEILEKVNLKGLEKRRPNTLSGGQRQRVSIARALVKEPKLLLCDEPTGQLDKETSKTIFEILKEISKESLVIVVSHDEENAKKYADEIIKIEDGIANNKEKETKEKNFTLDEFKLTKKNYLTLANGFLRSKITRLIIAMIISIMVFVMIGVSDTISSYDKSKAILEALYENDNRYVPFNKEVKVNDEIQNLNLNDDDVEILTNKLKNYEYDLIYNLMNGLKIKTKETISYNDYYYKNEISGTCEINSELINRYNLELIAGRLPNDYNEIVITKYIYEMYNKYGYSNGNESTDILSFEDILNKTIKYENKEYKIIGILDTKLNPKKYEKLKNVDKDFLNTDEYLMQVEEIKMELKFGFHNVYFFKNGFYENKIKNNIIHKSLNISFSNTSINAFGLKKVNEQTNYQIYWRYNQEKIEDKKVLIPLSSLYSDKQDFENSIENIYQYDLDEYATNNYKDAGFTSKYQYLNSLGEDKKQEIRNNAKTNLLNKKFESITQNGKLSLDSALSKKRIFVNVVGIYDDFDLNGLQKLIIGSTDLYNECKKQFGHNLNDYIAIIFKLTKNQQKDLKIINIKSENYFDDNYFEHLNAESNQSTFNLTSEVILRIEDAVARLKLFVNIFKIMSFLLVFVCIGIISFYYSGVINEKEKEIGILRALGSSKFNIIKIFLIQTTIIFGITIITSTILSLIGIQIVNGYITKIYSLSSNMYYFSIRQVLIMLIIEFIILFIGIIIPLIKLLKKKPVDIIQNR